jgi:hypothetical protein
VEGAGLVVSFTRKDFAVQATSQPTIDATVISSGVDWITATNQGGSVALYSDDFATHEFERAADLGAKVSPSSRLGYVGYSTEHFFYGSRGHGRMLIASGSRAHDLFRSVVELSDNITRLDVQVTIWTHGEQPHLGRQAYACLRGKPPARVSIRNVQLIDAHPSGETCNVGKRSSDQYGRIYDKATEAKLGTPRTVWRYEVEVKRRVAGAWASALGSGDASKAVARSLVRTWFADRGLQPPFSEDGDSNAFDLSISRKASDTLAWFRDSLSKTVAREVEQHGLAAVVDALGLSRLLSSTPKEVVPSGTRY